MRLLVLLPNSAGLESIDLTGLDVFGNTEMNSTDATTIVVVVVVDGDDLLNFLATYEFEEK